MTKVLEKLAEAKECCTEGMGDAVVKARTALADARDGIIHAAPVEKARAGARAVDDYAHQSPWSFIGGVAVLALAVGWLLRRR
jgi:MYXO-CTERM domain-containing protein